MAKYYNYSDSSPRDISGKDKIKRGDKQGKDVDKEEKREDGIIVLS